MKCDERLNSVEFVCAKARSDSSDCGLPLEISFKSSFQCVCVCGVGGSTVLLGHMESSVGLWETSSSL